MIDSKIETFATQPQETNKGNRGLSYDSMRLLTSVAVDNWIVRHEAGRSDEKLLATIDDPNETDEHKAEAADIRYLRKMVRMPLRQPRENVHPSDKLFPLRELDDDILVFVLANTQGRPAGEILLAEAQRRKLQLTLDSPANFPPRDLVEKIAYTQEKTKSNKVK